MRALSPQRRKVILMAASVACMSSCGPVLFKRHSQLMMVWIASMAIMLVYTISEFIKLKRSER